MFEDAEVTLSDAVVDVRVCAVGEDKDLRARSEEEDSGIFDVGLVSRDNRTTINDHSDTLRSLKIKQTRTDDKWRLSK
jgi:hypothetical protein